MYGCTRPKGSLSSVGSSPQASQFVHRIPTEIVEVALLPSESERTSLRPTDAVDPETADVRILVVDDEESLADMVASSLRFVGYGVDTELRGYDALRSVKASTPDLIVLDVNLPDIDGFEVCRRIRRDGVDAPVIFLTARDAADDIRAGFMGGGDDYLTKPFSLEELSLRIEAVLRRAGGRGEAGHRVVTGSLVLDEDSHQVFVDGVEIELSPTEFRLLRYLMLNQGRVVSKLQILEYVWEYDFDGRSGVVDTYISYLRRKLGPGVAESLRTIRGIGYVLRTPDGPE